MRKLFVVLLLFVGCAQADQWSFFYPELVNTYSCHVQAVELHVNGLPSGEMKWAANAEAERKDHTKWGLQLGLFPFNLKGKHSAEKACFKWSDEAEKKIRKAQGGR